MDYADLLYQAAKAGDIAKVDEIVTNHGVNVRNDGQSNMIGMVGGAHTQLTSTKRFANLK